MNAIDSLTESLIQKGYIPKEERDLYLYGFDITFYQDGYSLSQKAISL